jgi:hypothetical protein
MPTSVHIPRGLLDEVDRRARYLGVSRNRFIVRAIEKELSEASWPPGFFEHFRCEGPKLASVVQRVQREIARSKRSKQAPKL